MALVTIQILEGLERGRIYRDLPTPITIGREDENSIQLNDERVSRFHAKMQDDGDSIILTDLESTNGTRVNGHPLQLRVLRPGDQVGIGRCLLLFGSDAEIQERAYGEARDHTLAAGAEIDDEASLELFPLGPPEMPTGLTAIQRARFADLLSYTHDEIRRVLEAAAETPEEDGTMEVTLLTWQRMLHLEKNLATYLRRATDPE